MQKVIRYLTIIESSGCGRSMGKTDGSVLKYSKIPLNNFNRSIKKAHAFFTIYSVLDNFEKGKYDSVFKGLTDLGKDFQNDFFPPDIQRELKKRIKDDKILKNKMEKKASKFVDFFKQHEAGVKSFLESFKLAKEEILLEQSLVLTISAFEIFTKDSAIQLVNRNHSIHERFKPEIKEKLNLMSLQINSYDFSNSIGNLLWDEQTFFNIKTISDIFSKILLINQNELFPSGPCKNKIHKYIELRHLIVHRNSIVDKKLYEQTGINKRLGKRYPLAKNEVGEAIKVTTDFVNHLFAIIEKSTKHNGKK